MRGVFILHSDVEKRWEFHVHSVMGAEEFAVLHILEVTYAVTQEPIDPDFEIIENMIGKKTKRYKKAISFVLDNFFPLKKKDMFLLIHIDR